MHSDIAPTGGLPDSEAVRTAQFTLEKETGHRVYITLGYLSDHWRSGIESPHLLIFILDGLRYALKLESVARVLRAAAVTPLPHAPDVVLGVLDLHGDVIPVISLRKRFGLPERSVRSEDLLVIASSTTRTVALAVDGTEGIVEQESVVPPDHIVTGTSFLAGVTRTAQGLVLIHDLETVLFPDEEQLLAQALELAQ